MSFAGHVEAGFLSTFTGKTSDGFFSNFKVWKIWNEVDQKDARKKLQKGVLKDAAQKCVKVKKVISNLSNEIETKKLEIINLNLEKTKTQNKINQLKTSYSNFLEKNKICQNQKKLLKEESELFTFTEKSKKLKNIPNVEPDDNCYKIKEHKKYSANNKANSLISEERENEAKKIKKNLESKIEAINKKKAQKLEPLKKKNSEKENLINQIENLKREINSLQNKLKNTKQMWNNYINTYLPKHKYLKIDQKPYYKVTTRSWFGTLGLSALLPAAVLSIPKKWFPGGPKKIATFVLGALAPLATRYLIGKANAFVNKTPKTPEEAVPFKKFLKNQNNNDSQKYLMEKNNKNFSEI